MDAIVIPDEKITRYFLKVCRMIHAKGLVSGSGGNISMRIGDVVLITPTGRNLGMLNLKDLVCMDLRGKVLQGGKPSQEWRMHLACFSRPDVKVVAHVHSLCATTVACLPPLVDGGTEAAAMPAYTPGYAARVGVLPLIPYYKPGSEELSTSVEQALVTRNSVLLANHGLVTIGATIEQALNLVEEIEENAHIFLLLNGRGISLSKDQMTKLGQSYR